MEPICDVADWYLIFCLVRPKVRPHLPGYLAVKLAYTIGEFRHAQPVDRHRQLVVSALFWRLTVGYYLLNINWYLFFG